LKTACLIASPSRISALSMTNYSWAIGLFGCNSFTDHSHVGDQRNQIHVDDFRG
jgi:hypothetical protein